MTRILLVCPEPLGHGQPAGIGIRLLEFTRVLLTDGHEITVLSPDAGRVDGARSGSLTPENIARYTAECDVAIVEGHATNEVFAHGKPLPVVVDLYDPYIVQNLHYYATRGPEVFSHDHVTLTSALLRGDLFLCASEAQRLFYLGALLAVGRLNPLSFRSDPSLESLVRIVPFGVQPPRPVAPRDPSSILFGGIYDWYDPVLAIDAVAVARKRLPSLTLTFTTHPNPEITPQGKAAEAVAYVAKRGYASFVRFEPWFAYDKRGEFFERFGLALMTFPQSIETDLSMRTRVYDYLWGGLPIISSPAPGTDELLERYRAGRIVRIDTPEEFANEIVAAATDKTRYDEMSAAARHFVTEHQWPEVLEPLRAFCRAPRVDETKNEFAARWNVPAVKPSILDRLKRRIGGGF